MPISNFSFTRFNPDIKQLIRQGPVLPIQVLVPTALEKLLRSQGQQVPPPVSGFALIDTGATKSAVDDQVIRSLKVAPIGKITTHTAGGVVSQNLYPVRFHFPVNKWMIEFSSVIGVNLKAYAVMGKNLIALVGRDVLSRCIFIYNGTAASFTVAF